MKSKTQIMRAWLLDAVLPMWMEKGRDAATGLSFESLTRAWAPAHTEYHRAMVAARQAFFFFRMGALFNQQTRLWPVAEAQMALLMDVFVDHEQGGWLFSVDRAGKPLDKSKDLYTYAFILLAAAEAYSATQKQVYLDLAEQVLDSLTQHFSDPESGLYYSRLSADHSASLNGLDQNSHMHLFEAVSHLCSATGSSRHQEFLQRLMDRIHDHFYDPQRLAILELPLSSPINRIEPGHQFEWYFLINQGQKHLANSAPHRLLADAIFEQACRVGLELRSTRVPLSMNTDFSVKDGSYRIWGQLELIRALALRVQNRPGEGAESLLAKAMDSFHTYFMSDHGWNEWIDDHGSVRVDLPASTPYHMVGCWEALAP